QPTLVVLRRLSSTSPYAVVLSVSWYSPSTNTVAVSASGTSVVRSWIGGSESTRESESGSSRPTGNQPGGVTIQFGLSDVASGCSPLAASAPSRSNWSRNT